LLVALKKEGHPFGVGSKLGWLAAGGLFSRDVGGIDGAVQF